MREAVEHYLRSVREIHGSGGGVRETSYYGALEALFTSVGHTLTPRVRCILHVRNVGAGIPDGGFFTADQLQRLADDRQAMLDVGVPARGVIEVKGAGDDLTATATSAQVGRYLETYGQVLVTNLRGFVMVGQGDDGQRQLGERFDLVEGGERLFWQAIDDPAEVWAAKGEQFAEYLRRVLLIKAPLTEPKFLAFFLASYARDAAARLERGGTPGLTALRGALEQALGLRFQGERGEHFFRSTLVQTLFYGVFSAWVLWSKEPRRGARDVFDWKDTGHLLRVPAITALFDQVGAGSTLRRLNLTELLDRAGAALNRVERGPFFARFEEAAAVQYFYEPFLEAFDPALRQQLGVWYTPPEVVEYMVARVDRALREELGIRDGLADERVLVLDPCTGTGSYLVATLRRIERTLRERGDDALLGHDLKRAATERLRGFEILPAPYVVAHLQLGLLLQELGAPLDEDRGERAGVYLTNALTGWGGEEATQIDFLPELMEERDAAAHVKRDERILVVIGNPPYNGFAGVGVEEERLLSDAYRTAVRTKQPQGQGLNDLYVRFFRMAERRIVEQTGEGIVCFISNYSWLDGLSFTAMRERYLDVFDEIWIDNLNGDKYKTGKVTPEGAPDPSIFSTPQNREGIQVGTAIATMVRQRRHAPAQAVRFRNLWGRGKLAQLGAEAEQPTATTAYVDLAPASGLGFPLMAVAVAADYLTWPLLPDLFPVSFPGVKTSRDDVLVDIDREALVGRMERYFDPGVSDAAIGREIPGVMEASGRFDPVVTRKMLVGRGFLPHRIVRYHYRPFDVRWLYWEPTTDLLDRKREEYEPHVAPGNQQIVTQQKPRREWASPQVTSSLGCIDLMDRSASFFPMHLRAATAAAAMFEDGPLTPPAPLPPAAAGGRGENRVSDGAGGIGEKGARDLNLSDGAWRYLQRIGASDEDLFVHAVAMLHAPAYARENAGALRQDWPRVPLPGSEEGLRASAGLGRRLAALLDPEIPVPGVTDGRLAAEMREIAALTVVDGSRLDIAGGDLRLTAGWGRGGGGRAVMPGQGRTVRRSFAERERATLRDRVNPLGLESSDLAAPLGGETVDVFLNGRVYWRNVPEAVWGYTLGGYPVLKKWLSYREEAVLGRGLGPDEARLFTQIARRIAAILLLGPELDANYRAVVRDGYAWQTPGSTGTMRMW